MLVDVDGYCTDAFYYGTAIVNSNRLFDEHQVEQKGTFLELLFTDPPWFNQ